MARSLAYRFVVLDHLSIVVSGLGDQGRLIDNAMTALRTSDFPGYVGDAKDELFAPRAEHIRVALRHVQRGRQRIKRQYEIIERLHACGLPTDQAERFLERLKNVQLTFEDDYNRLLRKVQERVEAAAGYKGPIVDWRGG